MYDDVTTRPDRDTDSDGVGDGDGVADNYFAHKYSSSKPEYFQARYGKVYELLVDDKGNGSIAIYPEGSQDGFDQMYNLTDKTKYYTLDDRGNVVDIGHSAITEGINSSWASASNVLVVSYDEKVVGVYIMPAVAQQ